MPKHRILVVDDDKGLLRLLEMGLELAGYDVTTVTTGEQSVQSVRAERPNLVLMDIMMPGIDGFEAAQRIRKLPEGNGIPIIFLSALDHEEARAKGMSAGGNDYITKPASMNALLIRLATYLPVK